MHISLVIRESLLLLIFSSAAWGYSKCKQKPTQSGFLCVCNSEYCDTTPETPKLPKWSVHKITTAKSLPGFNKEIIHFSGQNHQTNSTILVLNRQKTFQSIKGFGGSFSDAFGVNVLSLSKKTQNALLRSYFGEDGLRYNLCRVPIGGTDFSLRAYTYDDVEDDVELKHFNLTQEDFSYKISLIKRANKLRGRKVSLVASNWAPPHWMKVQARSSASYLKENYYQVYSDYQIRFLEEYKKLGLDFWGITAVNEPLTGLAIHFGIDNLIMLPEQQRKWIGHFFGPSLEAKGFADLKILTLDDQRKYISWWMDTIMADKEAAKYVSGVALHWYFDKFASPFMIDETLQKYPDKFVLYTESSVNKAISDQLIDLGSWMRGALYAYNIIENLNHWSVGWIDWNMALDMSGGPSYIGGNCEAPILVEKSADEFYKQPMFYMLGHFSAFTSENSQRLEITQDLSQFALNLNYVPPWPIPVDPVPVAIPKAIHTTATKNPDESITIFILNGHDHDVNVTILDSDRGTLELTLVGESMNSFIYW